MVVAFMLCLVTAGFAQQILTSLKGGVMLNNKQEAAYEEGKTYFYIVKNTDLQLYKTEGVFVVSDYYERDWFGKQEPDDEYEGVLGFTFSPVNTEKGAAIKINSDILDWDGLDLKGATLMITEDETGLRLTFTQKQCRWNKKSASKTFEILIPSDTKPALTAQQLSKMAAKEVRLALAAI